MRARIPAVLLVFAGCAGVTVTPSKGATPAAAKDENCVVEFWPDRPERAFDELAEVKVSGVSRRDYARELMRQKACALGADAIVGLHEALAGDARPVEIGTAVRYRTR